MALCGQNHGFSGSRKAQALLWVVLSIGFLLVVGSLVLNTVTVPYVTTETYQEQEPYLAAREYTVQEPYSVRVNYTEYVTEKVEEKIPILPNAVGSRVKRPLPYDYEDCGFKNYDYFVQYFDGSKNDLAYMSDINFKAGGSTDPVRTYLSRFEYFEPSNVIGYNERINIFHVAALFCNRERMRLNGRFQVCRYWNGTRQTCPDVINVRVSPRQCEVKYLPWYTRDAVGKTLRLEPVYMSQKFACEPKGRIVPESKLDINDLTMAIEYAHRTPGESKLRDPGPISGRADYSTVYPTITNIYHSRSYRDLFGYYAEQQGYQSPIVTKSGTLGIPRKYRSNPIPDTKAGFDERVTSATRTYLRTMPVTKFRNETKYQDVVKTQNVTEYRTVEKTREVIKHRTLLDAALLKLGFSGVVA